MASDAYHRAVRLLSMREHGRVELKNKLLRKGFDAEQIDMALQRLSEQKLLSEQRYVEIFIRSQANRGMGPIRIRRALQDKQVEQQWIDAGFSECEEDWHEHLLSLWQRKFSGAVPVTPRDRQKQMRFLMFRGFASDAIHRLLREGKIE